MGAYVPVDARPSHRVNVPMAAHTSYRTYIPPCACVRPAARTCPWSRVHSPHIRATEVQLQLVGVLDQARCCQEATPRGPLSHGLKQGGVLDHVPSTAPARFVAKLEGQCAGVRGRVCVEGLPGQRCGSGEAASQL